MHRHHLVRVGLLGHVGRFASVDAVSYPRGSKVIVRTSRGLETGEVLAPTSDMPSRGQGDGSILRGMTVEDRLLQARLDKHKDAAFQACAARIRESGLSAILMDVEHLFDGRRLYFYFLGEVPLELEQLTSELASAYEAHSQIRKFAETVTAGCGPDCGTEAASGCGTSCISCAVAGACATKSA